MSGFWKQVADVSGLTLDQYEDDEVPSGVIPQIALVFDGLISRLRKGGATQEHFVYAWTQCGDAIEAQVSAQGAIPVLEDLRLFLREAYEAGQEVLFSL